MRLFMINVLATATLLFVAGQASAITITQTGLGTTYNTSDTITLQYWINNIGDPGLSVMAFTVQYNNAVLTYTGGLVKNKILGAADDESGANPGYVGQGLIRITKTPFEPNANEISFNWQSGTTPTWGEVSNQLLGTAVFHATGPGVSGVNLANGQGSTFLQTQGTYASPGAPVEVQDSVNYVGSGDITVVPEPTTALLIGLGLVGLGVAGNRGRQER
mgnify:FL=1